MAGPSTSCYLLLCLSAAVVSTALADAPARVVDEAREESSGFLSNWMGELMPVIGDLTLLDVAVPITHDTLTYDLGTQVSQGAWDDHPAISELLHLFPWVTPGEWIRTQARTQGLTVVEQLDAGVRFLDFRMMLNPKSGQRKEWTTLHFVEGNTDVLDYWRGIRQWVDAHPKEVVIVYTSRHGGVCETGQEAFPYVTQQERRDIYGKMKAVFDGVLFDSEKSTMNSTTVSELVARNQRVVLAVGDYKEFTQGDHLAIDACQFNVKKRLKNSTGDLQSAMFGGDVEPFSKSYVDSVAKVLEEAATKIEQGKALNGLYSEWTNHAASDGQMVDAFYIKYVPLGKQKYVDRCVGEYAIPGMSWCPPGLLDNAQLANYYLQVALEDAHSKGIRLPSIAVNVIDREGTVRTGTKAFAPGSGSDVGYAFVDTLLASNVRVGCAGPAKGKPECTSLLQTLEARRAKFPLRQWDDAKHGRLPAAAPIYF